MAHAWDDPIVSENASFTFCDGRRHQRALSDFRERTSCSGGASFSSAITPTIYIKPAEAPLEAVPQGHPSLLPRVGPVTGCPLAQRPPVEEPERLSVSLRHACHASSAALSDFCAVRKISTLKLVGCLLVIKTHKVYRV